MAKQNKLTVQYVPLDKIKPYDNNPRRNDKAIPAVTNSIVDFGFRVPLVIDKDYVIVCGHTRFLAAQRLHMETVPVIIADDLTEEQVRAFRVADNRVAEIAEWDKSMLAEELAELKGIFNMSKYGFSDDLDDLKRALKTKQHKCPKCGYEW